MGIYDMFDDVLANELGVSVEEYINKIESVSQAETDRILLLLFSSNDGEVKLGKQLFHQIKL